MLYNARNKIIYLTHMSLFYIKHFWTDSKSCQSLGTIQQFSYSNKLRKKIFNSLTTLK